MKEVNGDPLAIWDEICTEVEASDLVSGRNPVLASGAIWDSPRTLAWALSPSKFMKLLEKGYTGGKRPAEEPAHRPFVPVVVEPPPPELTPEEEAARKEQVIQKWAEFRRRLGQTAVAGR